MALEAIVHMKETNVLQSSFIRRLAVRDSSGNTESISWTNLGIVRCMTTEELRVHCEGWQERCTGERLEWENRKPRAVPCEL